MLAATDQPMTQTVAPLRVGKIATDSVETYRQLLHTAAAGHYALESTAAANSFEAKMKAAGAAWRHLAAAGPWQHERENCPPQLLPEFTAAVQLIVLLLTAQALQDKWTPYRIKVLQGIVSVAPPRSDVQQWATDRLREALAVHWATMHTDPNDDGSEPNVIMAYAACTELGDCGMDVVANFVRTAATVGGMSGLYDAQQRIAAQGGATGLMEVPKNILDVAMPLALLSKGTTDLTRHSLTQTAMVADGTQLLHLRGPGVVMFISKVPTLQSKTAPAPAAAASRWWAPRLTLPSLPSLAIKAEKVSPPVGCNRRFSVKLACVAH